MLYISALISFLALLFDWLLGDPPNRYHPTAWMGNLIAWFMRFRPSGKPAWESKWLWY